jgi:hypothetical protein
MKRGKGGGTHRRGCRWRRFLHESSAVASPRRPHLDKKQGGSVEVARGDLRRGDAREKFLRVVLAAFKWGCSGRHRGEEMEGGGAGSAPTDGQRPGR